MSTGFELPEEDRPAVGLPQLTPQAIEEFNHWLYGAAPKEPSAEEREAAQKQKDEDLQQAIVETADIAARVRDEFLNQGFSQEYAEAVAYATIAGSLSGR